MMKFKRLCLSLCVALLAVSAQAEQLPMVSEADRRIQLFNYNPCHTISINYNKTLLPCTVLDLIKH